MAIMCLAMPPDSPSRQKDQYIVRFPDGMRDRLKEEAAKNNRSMNAEILARLEESFDTVDHGMTDAMNLLRIQYRVILDLLEQSGGGISPELRADMERLAYSKNHNWKPYDPEETN